MIPQIPRIIDQLPFTSSVLLKDDSQPQSNNNGQQSDMIISKEYQYFFDSLSGNLQNTISRGGAGLFLNPDFNLLSTNGTSPVTPGDGSNLEFSQQWFLVNSGGTNDYTITPTAVSAIQYYGTGSNYFINANINTYDETQELYFYNLNYSPTSLFNSISYYSGRPLNFSYSIENVGDADEFIQFSAVLNGMTFPDGSSEIKCEPFQLQAGQNIAGKSINIPLLNGTSYSPTDFMQLRMYFLSANSTGGAQLKINYLKSELNDDSSHLEVNHILQKIICNAWA